MNGDSNTVESWKTPIVGKSCSGCAVKTSEPEANGRSDQRCERTVDDNRPPEGAGSASLKLQDGEILANRGSSAKYKGSSGCGRCATKASGSGELTEPLTSDLAALNGGLRNRPRWAGYELEDPEVASELPKRPNVALRNPLDAEGSVDVRTR